MKINKNIRERIEVSWGKIGLCFLDFDILIKIKIKFTLSPSAAFSELLHFDQSK
jgi:hypothetical protein